MKILISIILQISKLRKITSFRGGLGQHLPPFERQTER